MPIYCDADASMPLYVFDAEYMDLAGGYQLEDRSDTFSKAGSLIFNDNFTPGTATQAFDGIAGTYQFDLTVYDETDGNAPMRILINGQEIESFVLDDPNPGADAGLGDGSIKTLSFPGIALEPGDVITIEGTRNGGAPARIDKLELFPDTATAAAAEGDDKLLGGDGEDTIFGNGGDDTIIAGEDDDVVKGGNGDDVIEGNGGDDNIHAGNGDDTVLGGSGDDTISVASGGDLMFGGAVDDLVEAAHGVHLLVELRQARRRHSVEIEAFARELDVVDFADRSKHDAVAATT